MPRATNSATTDSARPSDSTWLCCPSPVLSVWPSNDSRSDGSSCSSCTTWSTCGLDDASITVLSVAKLTCSATLPVASRLCFIALALIRSPVGSHGHISMLLQFLLPLYDTPQRHALPF